MDALNCSTFATQGQTGWALHKRVFDARNAKRYAEAICLATHSLNAGDKSLAGASHYETAKSWKGLGCEANAGVAIEASVRVRPRGQNGWKETCQFCIELGMPCGDCRLAPTTEACPPNEVAAAMLVLALLTSDKISVLKCAPGSFPNPGWAMVAWVGEPADLSAEGANVDNSRAARLHHFVFSTVGEVLVDSSEEASWHQRQDDEVTKTIRLESADLDGNGIDEVLEETEYTRRGYVVGTLSVFALKGKALGGALKLQTSYDDSGMDRELGTTSCTANWTVSDDGNGKRELVVTARSAGGPDANKCVKGVTRYQMRAGKLVRK
ncbi:MAG: hypothetical protein JWP01_2548 [Myxococcales bacterium]|nr:hypothetical protein [Myxococcales bacterium]